jgi:hypothetical protein
MLFVNRDRIANLTLDLKDASSSEQARNFRKGYCRFLEPPAWRDVKCLLEQQSKKHMKRPMKAANDQAEERLRITFRMLR